MRLSKLGTKEQSQKQCREVEPAGRRGIGSGGGRKSRLPNGRKNIMNHKIAILSDIHGNATALEAVDCRIFGRFRWLIYK